LSIFSKYRNYIIFGISFHLLAIFLSEGPHRPDEHLGIIRLMNLKLGLFPQGELSWEFPLKIRPWIQPAFYAFVGNILALIGLKNPFTFMTFMRFLTSLISIASIFSLAKILLSEVQNKVSKKMGIFLLFNIWYFPFFHARTTNENLGIAIFTFCLALLFPYLKQSSTKNIPYSKAFIAGLLLSLSFYIRYQMAFMIFPFCMWILFFKRPSIPVILNVAIGFLIMIGLNVGIDYWGYGELTFTPWNYFYENIMLNKASGFGVDPWWKYLSKTFLRGMPPFSLLFLLPPIWFLFKRPKSLWTWLTIPYFVVHSIVGHKELRFIFALGAFIPIMAAILYQEETKVREFFSTKFGKIIFKISIFQNIVLMLISSVKPAFSQIPFYKHLYNSQDDINKIYTISVFRDQMVFYLKRPIAYEHVPELEKYPNIIESSDVPVWILTNSFSQYRFFSSLPNCTIDYRSHPEWLLKYEIGKWPKRSKVWMLYRCIKLN
jgi:phosphatidylinositol glycan class B